MRRLVLLFGVLALAVPAAAQGQVVDVPGERVPTKTDETDLRLMADAIGSDCDAAAVDRVRDDSNKIDCSAGKVVSVRELDDGTLYNRPLKLDRESGELSKMSGDVVSVTQAGTINSATGCHGTGGDTTWAYLATPFFSPGIDGSQWPIIQHPRAPGASNPGLDDLEFYVNYPRLAFLLETVDMNGAGRVYTTAGSGEYSAELNESKADWAYLRNPWCDYALFPANDGWYQNQGSTGSNANATGVQWTNKGQTNTQASLLPSCYRGFNVPTSTPHGASDGINTIDSAPASGWGPIAPHGTCTAAFQGYIAISTVLWDVPANAEAGCDIDPGTPTPDCHARLVEGDMEIRAGVLNTAGSAPIRWCLESQSECNGASFAYIANGELVFSLRHVLDHEFGHWLGLGHYGSTEAELMFGAGTEIGGGHGTVGRIGCNEARFMHSVHKQHHVEDNPYNIFAPGEVC